MTRRALIDCTLGPLQRHAARLLWAGRRESTKVSYSGKWRRFVDFCTITLPSEYGMHPRQALPASMSTVLLYLNHLSQEGEVREGSLNPYLAAINQMHQDAGFQRPALGHYVDLLRKGFANVEAQETSSAPARMPLPPAVVHDILTLGLASGMTYWKHFAKPHVLYFAIAGSIERIPAFYYVDRTCHLTSGVWP